MRCFGNRAISESRREWHQRQIYWCVALVCLLVAVGCHNTRPPPGFNEYLNAKAGLWELSVFLEDLLKEGSDFPKTFRDLCLRLRENEPTFIIEPDAPNPFPRFLPPGNYRRIKSWAGLKVDADFPVIWTELDYVRPMVVYMGFNGKVYSLSREEFIEKLKAGMKAGMTVTK